MMRIGPKARGFYGLLTIWLLLCFCGCRTTEPAVRPEDAVPTQEHVAQLPQMRVVQIEKNVPFSVAAADGTSVSYVLAETITPDGDCVIALRYGEQELKVFDFCSYLVDAYLIAGTETPILLVCADLMSDDYALVSCLLQTGEPVITGIYGGRVARVDVSSAQVLLYEHVDALGTWVAQRAWDLEADGRLTVAGDGMLTLLAAEERPLETVRELTVELLREGEWVQATLTEGTLLYPTRTDGSELVFFTLADGGEGRVFFESKEGQTYLDGIPDWEVFSNVMYAG